MKGYVSSCMLCAVVFSSFLLCARSDNILSKGLGNPWRCRGSSALAAVPYCGLPYAATNSYGNTLGTPRHKNGQTRGLT